MLPSKKTPPRTSLSDLTVLVYGPSKIGKSTWCAHSEGALFLATEAGLNNLDVYQVPVSTWDELLAACKEISEGKHPFKTVILDTVDNAYRMCAEHVCAKRKIEHESDLGYGKGYALINNEFYRVLNKLALLPYGLFLISHSIDKEFETRTGKHTRTVPTLPDKARKIVVGMVDVIAFCDLEAKPGQEGKPTFRRVMRTKPSPNYEAGDRTGRLPEVIDLDYQAFVAAFGGASGGAGTTAPRQEGKARPGNTNPGNTGKSSTGKTSTSN